MKEFNTTAVCIPAKHYMVDISDKVSEIRKMVEAGRYFTINRARQYGKTTTLHALKDDLKDVYTVISLDFQGIGNAGFASEEIFVQEFSRLLIRKAKLGLEIPEEIRKKLENWKNESDPKARLGELFDAIYDWCDLSAKGMVLLIDEVDSATNNQVFLDFLAQLRDGYIHRDTDGISTFRSVVLAGVTDIKHVKTKLRDDAESQKENSPWNIAADFVIDMSLSADGIQVMLDEYETDHHTGMDTGAVASYIREYTNGYPFLVSRICQLLDTVVMKKWDDPERTWSKEGVDEAVKMILSESNTLFQSLTSKINNYPELKENLHDILMKGEKIAYNPNQKEIQLMRMYGFIREENKMVVIDNRIFETILYDLFLSDEELKSNRFTHESNLALNRFVRNGMLDMPLILDSFRQTYVQVFGPLEDRFKEKDGRELFLLYLKPIINGTGNYYIEAQTRDQLRTDVIVDYLGQQYVIELKIWRGERYNEEGEKLILEYLDRFDLATGYMLSFNFNSKKESGVKSISFGDKVLYEVTV